MTSSPPRALAAVVVVAGVLLFAAPPACGGARRAQGDLLQVGELVRVRLNVTHSGGQPGGRVVVGFMMCNENACSKVELWGVAARQEHPVRYKTFVDCNKDGWGGRDDDSNLMHDSKIIFPATTVLLVTRPSADRFSVQLFDDHTGSSAARVALAKTMNRLYVKDHHLTQLSPDTVTIDFETDRYWQQECENGGVLRPTGAACVCAHGFDGPFCETACGPDRYGSGCGQRCTEQGGSRGHGRGCRGLHFEDVRDVSSEAKICGTGLHGRLCDEVCHPGSYGPGCSLSCGQCNPEPAQCDPYTGQCPAGCRPGYHGPTCLRKLTHLTTGPDIENVTETSVSGTFLPSAENTAGSGAVAFYDVQYREVRAAPAEDPRGWTAGVMVMRLQGDWSAADATVHSFVLDGLRPGVEYDVRVVLLDNALTGYEDVPQVRCSTMGTRRVSDVVVFNVTVRSATIAWRNPTGIAVLVRYECVKSLACSEDCSQTSGMLAVGDHENQTTTSIEGLLPGTYYRVLVSPRDAAREQAETATFTTRLTVPDALPEAVAEGSEAVDKSGAVRGVAADPGLVAVTNRSATFRWRMPDSCVDFNSVVRGIRWQVYLHAARCLQGCPLHVGHPTSGATTSTTLTLEPLQPGATYELRLWLLNTEGYNPKRFLSAHFTTVA